ncbi:5-deoxy-glucuronate isomerase [Streptomyces zagrosensis]|uniref:5-deoxy-glucuronate isomerase n=1 Tax=Streptomyces zagrosensis TaxID=1042984 RepID=A0A7W9UYS6_9ACTN|nr:5-deoxy-glucuronate isomerase [Streptomyces zagrosensis]MBB5935069.1 5-deoxy-glucuronate isomerase [Streptomyces zagrosensis]
MTATTPQSFHLPAHSAADGPYSLAIDPKRAGWGYSSLRVLDLPPGGTHELVTGESEWIVLPLSGGCTVSTGADVFDLHGRENVFSGVTDFAYLPRDAHARITSVAGGRFALTGARCEQALPARYGPASAVPVELRGTGACSRQVNNFGAAGVFACDKLIAVEVLTPGGNWSSYPPHKHDECRPGEESELEEIYYFEIADAHGTPGLGYQRVTPSGPGRETDVLAEVRTGDAVLIPDGWHGPSIAAPGHHLYYLNVMAGPGAERAWLIRDHPDHAWIRGTWPEQPVDPRLPFYTAPRPGGHPPSLSSPSSPASSANPASPARSASPPTGDAR